MPADLHVAFRRVGSLAVASVAVLDGPVLARV